MPVIDLGVQILSDTIQHVRRCMRQIKLLLRVWRSRRGHYIEAIGSRRNDVFGIGTPFSIDNLDCDQTGQALLLSASVECRELCADHDSRSRYGVLDIASRAWNVSSDRLEIIFDSAIARLVCGMAVVPLVLARLDGSGVMAVGVGEMGVVCVGAVGVLVRTSEAGLGRWARAWVENGSLDRVMAVRSLALDRVVTVVSMARSRRVCLVSMTRRIIPGRGVVVGISCTITQVGRVGTAIVDEIVQFRWDMSVTDRVVEMVGLVLPKFRLPPRLVSSPNGALHEGHSWDSNSLINS
jgi:hypothetical protein